MFSDYFLLLQDALTASTRFAGIKPGSGEGGKNREILVAQTLRGHLPPRAEIVQGGLLADTNGEVSNQVDVLVCNEFAFRGGGLPLGVVPVEALVAAIEVKSSQSQNSMKKLFVQTHRLKQLTKDIAATIYDGEADLTPRTGKPLVVGWFWQPSNHGSFTADDAADWLCNPTRHVTDKSFQASRPNAIYLHNSYVVIADPRPKSQQTRGAGKPNPFLLPFRNASNVLRKNKSYRGTGGTFRDVYHFEKREVWNPLEVIILWLAHEVNRYTLELPKFAKYVTRP